MLLDYTNKKTEEEIIQNAKKNILNFSEKFENLIFKGDNFLLLSNLAFNPDLSFLKEKIRSIYIDPPFAKNTSFKDKYGNVAYEDYYLGSDFIENLRERFILCKHIMKEGFIFVHSDYTIGHYIKIIMDEVFGQQNFFNEIVSARVKKNDSNANKLNVDYDHIYVFKIGNPKSNPLYTENKNTKSYWHSLDAKGQGTAKLFFGQLIEPPTGTHWRWSQDRIDQEIQKGTLKLNSKGNPVYLVEPKPIKLGNNWTDICCYSFSTKYPTEKSVEFLSRVINMSSNEGDYVLDFYGGSGSTAFTCELLNRNFITADIGDISINLMKNRLKKYSILES